MTKFTALRKSFPQVVSGLATGLLALAGVPDAWGQQPVNYLRTQREPVVTASNHVASEIVPPAAPKAAVKVPVIQDRQVQPVAYERAMPQEAAVGTGTSNFVAESVSRNVSGMPVRKVAPPVANRNMGIGGYVPAHQRMGGVQRVSFEDEASIFDKPAPVGRAIRPVSMVTEEVVAGPNFVSEGEVYYDGAEGYGGEYVEGEMMGDDCFGGDCWGCGRNGCCPRCLIPMPSFSNIEAFTGVQGFTGPMNRGGNGSFGFSEGLNWGAAMPLGLAAQLGMRATQSNLDGSLITPDDRTQMFVTAGFFRRVDLGLQGGLVFDYMHQDWDYVSDLNQLRGELSWKMDCGHEFGFWFAARGNRQTANINMPVLPTTQSVPGVTSSVRYTSTSTTTEATNIYAFFYRKQWANCGEGRVFGGWTDDNRGLVGLDGYVPLSGRLGLSTNVLYLVPATTSNTQFMDETWNVSINLVWSRQGSSRGNTNYCRPLFDVGNNGNFLVKRR